MQRDSGVEFADISSIFDNEKREVFTDGIHLRQEFQDVVAKSVYTAALPLVE